LKDKTRGQHEEQVKGATPEEGGRVDGGGAGDEEAEGGGGDARDWRNGEAEGQNEREDARMAWSASILIVASMIDPGTGTRAPLRIEKHTTSENV